MVHYRARDQGVNNISVTACNQSGAVALVDNS